MNSSSSQHHHLALPALPYPHYGLLGDPSQPPPPPSLFHHHLSSLTAVMSSPSDGRNGSGGGSMEEEDEEEEEEDNGNNREEDKFEAEDDGIGEGDIVQEANDHNCNHNHNRNHSYNHNHRSVPNGNVINPNPNSNSISNPNLKPKPKPKPNSNLNLNPNPIRSFEPKFPPPRYRECLKNHAASIGGHALDGCGEFMYLSDNTLCCSACGCHRNFHRREADADADAIANPCFECGTNHRKNRHVYHYHHHGGQTVMSFNSPQTPSPSPSPSPLPNSNSPNHHYSYQHQYQHHHHHPAVTSLRKRFRTKFTSEQKDRMLHFAEKVDWKIHKSDEAAVDAFSAEVGIKRSVLKVWMHNNKHTLGKKQWNNLNNNGSRQWADDDAMVEMEAPSTYSNSYPQQPKRTFSSGIHDGRNDDKGNNNMLVGMQEHDCSSGNTDRVDSSIKGGDCRSPHGDKSWDDCHLFDVHLVGPSASSLPQLESEQHSST